MDISNISSVSTDTNCYQSIIEGDSPSMYFSFNETLTKEKKSEDVPIAATENVAEIANEITMDEDFLKSNPGTVIKKEFEKSPLRCSVINKNLYLNLKALSSHTSTPSQSPKIRRSINHQQKSRNNSFMGTKPNSVLANISGVVSLLEKQDFENVTENPLKLENSSHISNSFQATSVTSSLFEFEKFEKIFEEGQQKDDNFTGVTDNENENESFGNKIKTDQLLDDINLSKITIDDDDKYIDEIRFTPTPMKGIENIEDRKTPIIVIVPPSEDCEKLLKLQNNMPEKKIRKSSVYVNDEIIPTPCVNVLDENKENIEILSIDEKENQLPRVTNTNNNIVIQKTPLIKNENIKQDDIQNSNENCSTSDEIQISQIQKNSAPQKQKEESAISSSEYSSSVQKTTIELGSVSVTPVVSEDSSIKKKQYESSAKESDDNQNVVDISKKKVRRSIRQDTRKSLIIEETDSSDTCGNKSEKFQKLNTNNKKQLRRPSTVHFCISSVSGLSNKPDLLANTLSKDAVNKRKSIKLPRPSTVNLPRIDEKRQIKESIKKQEKQLTNTGAVKKTVVRKSILPSLPPPQQQNQQKKSQENIATTSEAADKKKIIQKISVAEKRMSIVKGSKIPKNSPKLLKPKTRTSQIFKTLNSPSIIRKSIGLARSNARKSLIPTTTKITKPSALVSSSSTIKASAEPAKARNSSTSNTITTSTIAADTGEKFKIPAQLFMCRICHTSFKLKSTFEVHKKIHDICIKCEYCDKNFAFAKALDNHRLENCSRIPPLIKKKLVQAAINKKTEEQHQQPHHTSNFSNHPSLSSSTASSLNNVSQASNIDNKLKTDISGGISEVLSCDEKDEFLKPISLKNKKTKLPFTGIYRTPNKPIVCYKCKKNFLDVVEFTEHSISHSSSEST